MTETHEQMIDRMLEERPTLDRAPRYLIRRELADGWVDISTQRVAYLEYRNADDRPIPIHLLSCLDISDMD